MLQILLISPEEVAQGMPSPTSCYLRPPGRASEGVAEHIDNGDAAAAALSFRLVGDALFGWEHADEEDFR